MKKDKGLKATSRHSCRSLTYALSVCSSSAMMYLQQRETTSEFQKKTPLCTLQYWSKKDFPPATSCQEMCKKFWTESTNCLEVIWTRKREKKNWATAFDAFVSWLPHSFFRADFFFSSFSSWLGSLRLTSGSVWVRLAGIMSSSRSL